MLLTLKNPGFFLRGHLAPKGLLRRDLPGIIHRYRDLEKIMHKNRRKEDDPQIPQELNDPDRVYYDPDHRPNTKLEISNHSLVLAPPCANAFTL